MNPTNTLPSLIQYNTDNSKAGDITVIYFDYTFPYLYVSLNAYKNVLTEKWQNVTAFINFNKHY